ncbi:hypothetical protein OG439_20385 [Amycolatopsis sp. NBC_01307]|uniref:hypothetical protein n=1 Tax=Amycolatopsis sp. NBC_01307 TaxID=2903561 RepID=UPI002E1633B8|nr:hypothetical protein OG439_20385 [Amycolatopsis sp. NBC_01307]
MPLSPAGERLHSKVAAYLKSSDPAMLADAQTVPDAVEVARTVTSRSRDRPPNYRDAHAAGLLHWLRADHVDTAGAVVERGRALAYFLLLLRRHRGAIPDSALAEIAGMAARHVGKRDGVPLWSALAEQALTSFDEQGDDASLHCAALLLRFIVEAVDPADPAYSVYLATLILTLRRQREWAADPPASPAKSSSSPGVRWTRDHRVTPTARCTLRSWSTFLQASTWRTASSPGSTRP